MTKAETDALRRLLSVLKAEHAAPNVKAAISDPDAPARIYLQSWAIPIVQALLDKPSPSRTEILRLHS